MSDTPNDRLVHLHSLSQHPGWKMFSEEMARTEGVLYHHSVQAKDAHLMAKAIGGYATVKDLRTWLERAMASIQDELRAAANPSQT